MQVKRVTRNPSTGS